jgi:hypothetical protein
VRVEVGVNLDRNALSKRDWGAEVGEVGVWQHLHKVSAHRCTEVACETQRMVKDFKLAQPPPPPPITLESARTSDIQGVGEAAPRRAAEQVRRVRHTP